VSRIYRLFRETARREPRKPIICGRPGGSWLTLSELERRAETLGSRLLERGVRRGEIVMLVSGNSPGFVAGALAVWSRDAALLPVDESVSAMELEGLERSFRPAAVIRAGPRRPSIRQDVDDGPRLRLPGAAMIRLTSGSTGAPRGAVIGHSQAIADGRAIIEKMGLRGDDMNVGVIPLSHSYGFDNLLLPLVLQAIPLLLLKQALPSLIMKALQQRRPIVLPAVPYLLDLLARHPLPPRHSGLRLCISAGAPLSRRTARAFRERFGVPVRTFYGASEAGGITFDESPEADLPDGCVGTPLPRVKIELERRGLKGLPKGQGRVVVSGPAVGRGYCPEGSPDFGEGRFLTSDIGRFDERKRLHLVGRVSSLVNVSGFKVNPAEVERALIGLEGVLDAAVLGVRDSLRGQSLEAWIVPGPGEKRESIRSALSHRLAAPKIPRRLHLVASIPRTSRGKIDRLTLLKRR
jgi:long-chain acyl-CoA synthetase